MTKRSLRNKVVAGVVAVGSISIGLARPIRKIFYDFQWHKCNEAYDKFMNYNAMDAGKCECVSDSGGIPIFAYDSKLYTLGEWDIPRGYVLLRIKNSFEKETYSLAKLSKGLLSPLYTVLCYFVDKEEWSIGCK